MDEKLKMFARMFLKLDRRPGIRFLLSDMEVFQYVGKLSSPSFFPDSDPTSPFFTAIKHDVRTAVLRHFSLIGKSRKGGKRLHVYMLCNYFSILGEFTVVVHRDSWYSYKF